MEKGKASLESKNGQGGPSRLAGGSRAGGEIVNWGALPWGVGPSYLQLTSHPSDGGPPLPKMVNSAFGKGPPYLHRN